MPQWTLTLEDAGIRLDKYLAAPDRAGSRARAADALERGKVFVNDREASLGEAATRLTVGDIVRLWVDRPGSAKRRTTLGDDRDLPIVYEDDVLIVLNKPAALLAVPPRSGAMTRRRSSRISSPTSAGAAGAGRSSSTGSIATRLVSSCSRKPPRRKRR